MKPQRRVRFADDPVSSVRIMGKRLFGYKSARLETLSEEMPVASHESVNTPKCSSLLEREKTDKKEKENLRETLDNLKCLQQKFELGCQEIICEFY